MEPADCPPPQSSCKAKCPGSSSSSPKAATSLLHKITLWMLFQVLISSPTIKLACTTLSLSQCGLVKAACWEHKLCRRAVTLSFHICLCVSLQLHVSSCNDACDWPFSSQWPEVYIHLFFFYLNNTRNCLAVSLKAQHSTSTFALTLTYSMTWLVYSWGRTTLEQSYSTSLCHFLLLQPHGL